MAVPPVQTGSVGLVVQVAMIVAQPASDGVAVHWAKVGPVVAAPPVQIAAVGVAVQVAIRVAQPARVGVAVH